MSAPTVRSSAEMRFAASLEPCPTCGAAAPSKLDLYGNGPTWSLVSKCPSCHTPRTFSFRSEIDPLKLPSPERLHLGGPEPSRVIHPHQLLAEVARLEPDLHADPSTIPLERWAAQSALNDRAATALVELCKFVVGDAIPDSSISDLDRAAKEEQPTHYTRQWLEAQRDRVLARADRFKADAPRVWMLRSGKLHVTEEIRGILNQITTARVPTFEKLLSYFAVRSSMTRDAGPRDVIVTLSDTDDIASIHAVDDSHGMHVGLEVRRGTVKEVESAIGPMRSAGNGVRTTQAQVSGHSIAIEVAHDGDHVRRVTLWLSGGPATN
jgi:hypothetical protein